MIDNLSVESISKLLMNKNISIFKDNNNESILHDSYNVWVNFIMALTIWDEIWTFQKSPQKRWLEAFETQTEIAYLDNIVYPIKREMIDELLLDEYDYIILNQTSNSLERHLQYQAIANYLNIPFLSHPARKESYLKELTSYYFHRGELLNRIDNELRQYYIAINKELGREALQFSYPVLYDYITEESNTMEEEMKMAIKLRNDKDIVTYRKHMSDVEEAVARGDTQVLLAELNMISELSQNITSQYKKTRLGELTISLSPSISVPIDLTKSRVRMLHATFTRKLIEFGVYRRKSIWQNKRS